MHEEVVFYPSLRSGSVFQIGAVLLLSAGASLGIWQASQSSIGPSFILSLAPGLFAAIAIPLLAYRFYALRSASYTLRRDSIRLRWGLRVEEIPMTSVLWVYEKGEIQTQLLLPRVYWPGSVLGSRHVPRLGEVEFLAASARNLVIIAASEKFFAISPANPKAFVNTYHQFAEMGSLSPSDARSMYPTLLLRQVWGHIPSRVLIICGLVFSLGLLTWVSLVIPSRSSVYLSFHAEGTPGELVPAVRLLMLPVINIIFYLVDLFLGLFFFRRDESKTLAYLLWLFGMLTPLLFLVALVALLQAG